MRTVFFGRLIALFVLLLFASCSRLTVEPEAGMGSVTLEVATGGMAAPVRTIAPAQLTAADLADAARYTVRVSGRRSRGGALPETAVALDAGGRGTLAGLEDGLWHLTMTAYDAAGAAALLSGEATVEVRGPGARAGFVLTPRGVAGTGSFNIDVTWSAEDRDLVYSGWQQKIRKYELGLYSLETGAATAFVGDWTMNAGDNNNDPQTTFSWERRDIPAGQYLFKYTVTGGGLPDGASLCWQDNVYIEPGRETRQSIAIPRMAIVARAPTGFAGAATALSATAPGQYTGTLTWQDVYNANKYELEVMRYTTGTAHPTTDGLWTTAEGQAGSVTHAYNTIPGDPNNYTAVVAGRPRVTSGGLLGGGGTVTLALEIAGGESYAARLRAVGYLGPSDWVYLQDPLVPAPVAPASFSAAPSSIDIAGGTSTFPVSLAWNGGYVDAGGTWELQVLTFTGGTAPLSDGAWGSPTGRREYSYTSANYAPAGTPATRADGGLEPASKGLGLVLQDTADYYMARIRGRNSSGATTGWKYLSSVMVPQPAIVGDTPTQATRWTYAGSTRVQVWDVLMSIWGPQAGSNLRMEWLRCVVRNQEDADLDDAAWSYLAGLSANTGSNGKSVQIKGAGTNNMVDMNKGSTFFFRIRTETPYGNSAWYYYPVEVAAAP